MSFLKLIEKTLRVTFVRQRSSRSHPPRRHVAGSGLAPARLPTCQANRSGAARSGSSRRRGHRFPQARGESLPRRDLVFALDAAAAGPQPWRAVARQAARRGKRVAVLPAAAYSGHQDASAAWAAGVLTVSGRPTTAAAVVEGKEMPQALRERWEERAAIMAYDGKLPRAAARLGNSNGLVVPPPRERPPAPPAGGHLAHGAHGAPSAAWTHAVAWKAEGGDCKRDFKRR